MKIVFYSNFLTHHQLPFCNEMYRKYGDDFVFISTEKINDERISLGYKNLDDDYDFVLKAYENEEKHKEALDFACNADVAIIGSITNDKYGQVRLKQDKLTFRYYARIFYYGFFSFLDFKNLKKVYQRHFKFRKNKNLYMLSASSYSAIDFNKLNMYKNKCYKWGYFPERKFYNIDELLEKKNNDIVKIIWVGRFIKEKKPEYVIKLAKKLKQNGYKFKIQMLGNGKLFNKIKNKIEKNNLNNYIELTGAVDSNKVRTYMENSNIFICTSTKVERWGVVINEALNSGCAVVANKDIGSVPFLLDNNKNGLEYTNFKDFYGKVEKLIKDKNLREQYSINGYNAIINLWNEEKAVLNFSKLIESIINNKENPIKEGPGSDSI